MGGIHDATAVTGNSVPSRWRRRYCARRWTVVLLRELIAGSTRFNDLRRGVPRMSPALLSQRLKELEAAGVAARAPRRAASPACSNTSSPRAGRELEPLVEAFGVWGQRWVETRAVAAASRCAAADVGHAPQPRSRRRCPKRRSVIQFRYPELPAAQRSWWLVVEPDGERRSLLDRSGLRRRPLCRRAICGR